MPPATNAFSLKRDFAQCRGENGEYRDAVCPSQPRPAAGLGCSRGFPRCLQRRTYAKLIQLPTLKSARLGQPARLPGEFRCWITRSWPCSTQSAQTERKFIGRDSSHVLGLRHGFARRDRYSEVRLEERKSESSGQEQAGIETAACVFA